MNSNKPVIIWLLTGCLLVYIMVVIGGITRLTHSGLSMVEWNPILGSLPPMTDVDWAVPFQKYQQTPEYKLVNNQISLDEFKSIYWWEYIHRFIGRTIGVVFLIPFFYFLLRKRFNKPLLQKMIVLLLLGAFQGVVGWYMVYSGLQKEPRVSQYRLAAHLLSAFTVFGFTFWYALDLIYPQRADESKYSRRVRIHAYSMFGIIVLQILYGAFTAGLKAGLFYNTWPRMGNKFMPETVYSFNSFFQNILENPAGVQFVHRTLAYFVVIIVLFTWETARKLPITSLQRKASNIMLTAVAIQFVLGVITILYAVPVTLGVLHQTGAFFLFASSLFFIHTLRKVV